MDDYEKEWDEWDDYDDEDEERRYDGLDPAFTDWRQVDSMFYNKY